MNSKSIAGLAISLLLLFSCGQGQKQKLSYSRYSSMDNTYSFEVPSNVPQGKCIEDLMSFESQESHLIISIQHIVEKSLEEYVNNNDITNNSFSYDLFQSSDTTYFYKVTRGNNMWCAYDLYMLKNMEGERYIVKVGSDVIGESELIEMITHIYSSMKSNKGVEYDTASNKKKVSSVSLEKTYATKFYSIMYPKGWQRQEHLDEMTEVYIGSQLDNFGFTIVRFETDATLSEVNKAGNENIRQAGYRISSEKEMKVAGVKCYRAVHDVSIQGQKVKQISYTFKKGDMLYNIKFGSVTTKDQKNIAAEIIESFRFKSPR